MPGFGSRGTKSGKPASKAQVRKAAKVKPAADDKKFADQVNSEARKIPASEHAFQPGSNKVYISDVADRFGMSSEAFKGRLLNAYKKDRVKLSRVDLIQAANKGKVAKSQIGGIDKGYTFHMVKI